MSHKVPVVQWFILLKTKATQANLLHKNHNTAKTRASFIGRQASCLFIVGRVKSPYTSLVREAILFPGW